MLVKGGSEKVYYELADHSQFCSFSHRAILGRTVVAVIWRKFYLFICWHRLFVHGRWRRVRAPIVSVAITISVGPSDQSIED